jgi:prepilin-type N-terminal cleavage/methylation domain-containing protein
VINESSANCRVEAGFTLIEVAMAMVVILVALLGVVFTFTYVINYNAGNNSRSQALAVLQQEVEQLRAGKFTPTITDPALTGGTKSPKVVTSPSGEKFTVNVIVDNNPLVAGIQDETVATTLKEIRVTASLSSPSPGWQTAVPAMMVLRRTRAN